MQAADFDVVSPEEEKNGEGGALVRNTDKLAGILQRYTSLQEYVTAIVCIEKPSIGGRLEVCDS